MIWAKHVRLSLYILNLSYYILSNTGIARCRDGDIDHKSRARAFPSNYNSI